MVYINKERRLNEATHVRSEALQKAEHYEDLRRPFEDWSRQKSKDDAFIAEGLESLQNLIDFWRKEAETGEI